MLEICAKFHKVHKSGRGWFDLRQLFNSFHKRRDVCVNILLLITNRIQENLCKSRRRPEILFQCHPQNYSLYFRNYGYENSSACKILRNKWFHLFHKALVEKLLSRPRLVYILYYKAKRLDENFHNLIFFR